MATSHWLVCMIWAPSRAGPKHPLGPRRPPATRAAPERSQHEMVQASSQVVQIASAAVGVNMSEPPRTDMSPKRS